MTPSLFCCQSGNIDECGVCDGDGSACQKAGVVSITTVPSPATRKLSQSTAIDAHEELLSIEHQAGSTELEAIRTIPASHARDVLSTWAGSEYNDVVSEFELCICTSLGLFSVQKCSFRLFVMPVAYVAQNLWHVV